MWNFYSLKCEHIFGIYYKRKLEKAGFTIVHQRGSHVKFVRESEGEVQTVMVPNHREVRTVMVPNHREVRIGTLRAILRQAGLTPGEFDRL